MEPLKRIKNLKFTSFRSGDELLVMVQSKSERGIRGLCKTRSEAFVYCKSTVATIVKSQIYEFLAIKHVADM